MIYSFSKNQLFSRISSGILAWKWKWLSLREKHEIGVVSLGIRYISARANANANATETDEHSFTVSYLINKCGLSPQSALAVSKRVCFKTPDKPDSVLTFLNSHGFSKPQISSLIKKYPTALRCDPQKNLLPKFQFFYSEGISSSNLAEMLSISPHVLRCSLDSRIIPSFNFFKGLTHCNNDDILLAYKRYPGVLDHDFPSVASPNLAFLRECGVPESEIVRKLIDHPRVFSASCEKFKMTVEKVKNLGFDPLKSTFFPALQALLQLSTSTWERKFNAFKEWGWSEEEIVLAFRKFPFCMMYSEHKINAVMDFYVNTMGWKSSYFAYHPHLLAFSLEKRIIPRCSVLQVLVSKGLIDKELTISSLLAPSEKKFLQMFVTRYHDLHLLKLYNDKLGLPKQMAKLKKMNFTDSLLR